MPFDWVLNDYIALGFVFIFFLVYLMPSILEGEGSELKDLILSWFNKDVRRKLRKLELIFFFFLILIKYGNTSL